MFHFHMMVKIHKWKSNNYHVFITLRPTKLIQLRITFHYLLMQEKLIYIKRHLSNFQEKEMNL